MWSHRDMWQKMSEWMQPLRVSNLHFRCISLFKYILYFSNTAILILNPLQSAGSFCTVQHTQGHSSAAIIEQSPALVSLPISHSEPWQYPGGVGDSVALASPLSQGSSHYSLLYQLDQKSPYRMMIFLQVITVTVCTQNLMQRTRQITTFSNQRRHHKGTKFIFVTGGYRCSVHITTHTFEFNAVCFLIINPHHGRALMFKTCYHVKDFQLHELKSQRM